MDIEGMGQRLERSIKEKGYFKYEFAKLVGIRVSTLYSICRSGRLPSLTVFARFLEILGISADTLLDHHPSDETGGVNAASC